MAEVRRVEFRSDDSFCAGDLYLPAGVERPPVVVMGHGLGAVRSMGLRAYAERFTAAGMAALTFTYRHFGDSGGEPRQLLSVARQLEDWDAAIAYARSLDDVDGDRLALWGTSFGGGHALTVGAAHSEVRAVVSQCPFTSGPASVAAVSPRTSLRVLPVVVRDLVARLLKREPTLVPIAGPPGSTALMSAPDALPGILALVPEGDHWVNRATARTVLDILTYRPGRAARRVQAPLLVCVSTTDTVAPPRPTLRLVRRAPRAVVHEDPAGHFDFYLGAPFERLVAMQTDFLSEHLQQPG